MYLIIHLIRFQNLNLFLLFFKFTFFYAPTLFRSDQIYISKLFILLFKGRNSADVVKKKKQLSELCNKIDHSNQPTFKTRKICENLKMREPKPPLINQQGVVYNYKCDLCDAEYVGFTSQHLHQLLDKHRFCAIGKTAKERSQSQQYRRPNE